MSRTPQPNPRGRQVLALAGLVVLIPLAIAAWAHSRGRHALERLLTQDRLASASSLAAEVDCTVDFLVHRVRVAALHPSIHEAPAGEELSLDGAGGLRPFVLTLVVSSAGNEPSVSSHLAGHAAVLRIEEPIPDGAGRVVGSVVAEASLDEILGAARSMKFGKTGTTMVTDPRGQVLTTSDPRRADRLLAPEIVALIRSGRPGVARYFAPLVGRRELTAVAHVSRPRLAVLVSQGEAEALAPARAVGKGLVAGTLLLSFVGATLAAGLLRDLRRYESRLRAERDAAEQSSALLRAVMEGTTDLISVKDASGKYLMINSAGAALLGHRSEDVVGHDLSELVSPELASAIKERDRRVMEADHVMTFEETGSAAGASRTLLSVKAPLRGPDGTVTGVLAIARDITGRKHLEEALARSEARVHRILSAAHEAFVGMDVYGRVTEWNPEAERTFGWRREEAIGQPLRDLIIPPEQRDAHDRGLQHLLETGEGPLLNRRVEVTALDRGGERFPVELAIFVVQAGGSYEFFAFLRDLGERPRLESHA